MKIVFTAKAEGWDAGMDPRFGRASFLVLLDEESGELENIDNSAQTTGDHGAGPKTSQKVLELEPDIVITGNGPGGNALRVLEKSPVAIYIGADNMSVKDAYGKYKAGELNKIR